MSVLNLPVRTAKKTREKNTRLRKQEKLSPERLFLVANNIGFKDTQGKERCFTIGLPDELNNFLNDLK